VEVDPWSEEARSWSLLGALVAALEAEGVQGDELPLQELAEGLYALAGLIDTGSLSEWNDDSARTQAGVIEVLDRAIAACAIAPLPLLLSPN
jgi:hypothetical protein